VYNQKEKGEIVMFFLKMLILFFILANIYGVVYQVSKDNGSKELNFSLAAGHIVAILILISASQKLL